LSPDRIVASEVVMKDPKPWGRTAMLCRVSSGLLAFLLLAGGPLRAEDRSFDSNGVKIHYTVEGRGEPVVLIHGFAVNGELNWRLPGISKQLARDYQVITLDNRGHGKSDKPHNPRDYGLGMVDDVVRLLDHLHIKKAHVVGYSMGGFITNKLAVRYPERLLSATLGGAGWLSEDDKELKVWADELSRSLDEGKGLAPLVIRLTPAGKPRPTDEEIQAVNKFLMPMNDARALAAVVRGFKDLAVSEKELWANKVPTLALIGSLDPLKRGVDRMKDKAPGLEVIEIKDADHLTAFTNAIFIKSLKEFLAKHKQP
jgi:pimeloyl-ACP methyl ester carboxylesterase